MAGDRTWTIDSILRVTKEFFAGKGIESARLDAEILLTSVIDLTRVQLYTQYDRPLSEEELTRYRELVRRRGGLE
ncbi:MAG: peptide chain release factor N(5)-glutamine methyltransferase, partial [Myxococcota bacterium]